MNSKRRKLVTALVLMDVEDDSLHGNMSLWHFIGSGRNQMHNNFINYLNIHSQRKRHCRMQNFYEEWITKYLETDFFNLFRMTPHTLEILTRLISPLYDKFISHHHGGLECVPYEKCVMVTIWYLAKGETLISISDRFNIATSTCHRIVHNIIDCILQLLPKYICWPTEEECSYIAECFSKKANFDGVIGAIDGCHVECKIPTDQHDSYQDRRFDHSITLQGICAPNRLFTNVSVGWPGSIHDARILKESAIGRNIETDGFLHYFYADKYHLLGDSAYPLKHWLMTPYRDNGRLNGMQRKYNTVHSMTRVVIENVFGLLKGRWRILQFVNVYSVERAINIITACCILHNFCLINKDEFDDFQPIEPTDLNYSLPNNSPSLPEATTKRNRIATKF